MLNYNLLSAASGDSEGPRPPKQSKSAMEDLFSDVNIICSTPAKSHRDKILDEITVYKQEQVVPMSASPLIWWKLNEHRYPILSRMARCILNIPGTSVPSERIFSTAGDIVTATRSCLDPENIDKLIFLKKNL